MNAIIESLWQTIALTIGVVAFVLGNAYAEIKRKLNPETQPISAYLTGPYGVWESGGFLVFSLGLLALLGHGPVWWQFLVGLTVVALWFVVLTKWLIKYGLYGWLLCSDSNQVERIHLISAGVAFISAIGVEAAVLWPSPWVALPFLAPVSALAFFLLDRNQTAIEEKVYTIFLLAGMLVVIAFLL